jgi:hypothetical protein
METRTGKFCLSFILNWDKTKMEDIRDKLESTEDFKSDGPVPEQAPKFYGMEEFKPAWELRREQGYHRVFCQLYASGHTPVEIAEITGFSSSAVNNTIKQEWAQRYIAELMEKAGYTVVKNQLQGAAVDAAKTLINVMQGAIACKASDRVKAANDILNRLYPVAQTVLHGEVKAEELDTEELQKIVKLGNG